MADSNQAPAGRNVYVDFLRAFSLLVVVAWHWVFTIIVWQDDGPHATNPIGFTEGLFFATWLLQVMPLFFYVGGYGHLKAWARRERTGTVDLAVRVGAGEAVGRSRRWPCSACGSSPASRSARSSTWSGSVGPCCSSSARSGSWRCT